MSADDIASAEDIIEEARNGRMFILVDAPDRENEGDLVIPAQFGTPAAINFMAKHGRGLICLALTAARARELNLEPMSARNQTRHQTAFTVSIEAREGVSTGISAHDRAHTIAVAIDPTKKAEDIVSPGHVFPLVARDGGVLVRAGHTEASVDVARLAGLSPAGVICEIMNDDGSMARLPQLIEFAREHGLKIGAITDLIAFRRKTERLVERVAERPFDSVWGQGFRLIVFRHALNKVEHLALVRGAVSPERPTLVRMHRLNPTVDVLGEAGPRVGLIEAAVRQIAASPEGGVLVLLRDWEHLEDRVMPDQRDPAAVQNAMLREYGVGAQILRELGVGRMVLLSDSESKIIGLEGHGLEVAGRRAFAEQS